MTSLRLQINPTGVLLDVAHWTPLVGAGLADQRSVDRRYALGSSEPVQDVTLYFPTRPATRLILSM